MSNINYMLVGSRQMFSGYPANGQSASALPTYSQTDADSGDTAWQQQLSSSAGAASAQSGIYSSTLPQVYVYLIIILSHWIVVIWFSVIAKCSSMYGMYMYKHKSIPMDSLAGFVHGMLLAMPGCV